MEANGSRFLGSAHHGETSARSFCEVCGKPSQVPICGGCADKIRAEAMARKRREDKSLE
jgi:hypothetical protein